MAIEQTREIEIKPEQTADPKPGQQAQQDAYARAATAGLQAGVDAEQARADAAARRPSAQDSNAFLVGGSAWQRKLARSQS